MSALLHLASKIVERVNTEGAASTLRLIGARTRSLVRSLLEDRSRGVWTTRTMKDTELGISDRRNHWYVPTDYETFQRAIQRVSIRAGRDVFVDFGSGMGRIVMLAAALPFRRVIGV